MRMRDSVGGAAWGAGVLKEDLRKLWEIRVGERGKVLGLPGRGKAKGHVG